MSRQGLPDYLLIFRKWPESGETSGPEPVSREGLSEYVGESKPVTESAYEFAFDSDQGCFVAIPETAASDRTLASIHVWQRYASPVWFDIQQTDVLNCRAARDSEDEKHICPLQLGVIKRAVHLWTNPGDVVFSPFSGIGSELYGAVQMKRRAVGIELKKSYFKQAAKYLKTLENKPAQLGLFN
jgi:DNA modification methylase